MYTDGSVYTTILVNQLYFHTTFSYLCLSYYTFRTEAIVKTLRQIATFKGYASRDTGIAIRVSRYAYLCVKSTLSFSRISRLFLFFFFFIFLTRSFRVHARRQSKTHGKLISRVTTGLYLYRLQTKPVARKPASKRSLWACIVNASCANLAKRRLFERLH